MAKHKTATRKDWLTARLDLLKAEKEHTRRGDELTKLRQELPWVRVDKEYRFDTDTGKATLADLFRGRSQLLVYHFMFGPDYKAGCPACSSIADGFNGIAIHLANHDVMFSAVSRAPLAKLQAYKQRLGWRFPWASSFGSDFNHDFGVNFTEDEQRKGDTEYNYSRGGLISGANDVGQAKPDPAAEKAHADIAALVGVDWATFTREAPGMSSFVLDDGVVYHTYSAYARGLDGLWGMYQWLDRAALGRNEEGLGLWFKRNDEYGER